MEAFEESLASEPGPAEEIEFAPVLRAALDPLLAAVEAGSEALAPDAPSRCNVFLALFAQKSALLRVQL